MSDYITILTNATPCNKKVHIDTDGNTVKDGNSAIYEAEAETVHVPDAEAMADLLVSIAADPCKVLVAGYVDRERYRITTKAKLAAMDGEMDGVFKGEYTARLKDYFKPSSWIQLDRDHKPGMPEEWAELDDWEWLDAIGTFVPGAEAVECVRVASTSGRVLRDGSPIGGGGCRYWLRVADPSDVGDFAHRVKFAAIAAGYSFRSPLGGRDYILDVSVLSWERIVYDGCPVVGAGLELGEPSIEILSGEELLDTSRCVKAHLENGEILENTDGWKPCTVQVGLLTLDTEVETQEHGLVKVRDFLDWPESTVRCQAHFRESTSWNGTLTKMGGQVWLFDNGTHTRYLLSTEERIEAGCRVTPERMAAAAMLAPAAPVAAPAAPAAPAAAASINLAGLPDLRRTGQGAISARQPGTDANIDYVLQRHFAAVRFNMMTGAVDANMPELVRSVRSQFMRYNMSVSRDETYAELDTLARRDPFHPMEDWLQGLTWDGSDAIADALTRVPVSDPKLWSVYFRKWLIQTVAGVCGWRADGGQQLPHVLVFTGKHGAGKSTWLKNLLPAEFFTAEQSIHLDSGAAKDHQLVALRRPVAELSEIDSTFRKSEVSALKAFISRPVDEIRAPYAREAIPRPRMTSFCGSVNQKDFLVDQTGNRRFWPIEVTDDISRVPVQVEQLWAQAYQLHLAGEDFHLSEGEEQALHAEASARHQQENSYTDLIDSKFGKYMDRDRWGWATTTQLRTILNMAPVARGPGDAREFKNACLDYFPDFKVRIAGHRNVYRVPYVPEFSGYIREAKSELSPVED